VIIHAAENTGSRPALRALVRLRMPA